MQFTLDGEPFELTPDMVRARIANHVPEPIREYWVEIDGVRWPAKQAIALATGVPDRQRFQSQSARRWLANLGFSIGRGQQLVTAPGPPRAPAARSRSAAVTKTPQTSPDVVLVGCVKSKLSHGAPAKDLYTSDYFKKMRAYAEASGAPWFILSAEHGLVAPDDWLEPYERYLPDTTREYRRSWGQTVATQLGEAVGPINGLVVDIHAGAAYVESAEAALAPLGAVVVDQLKGLSFGRRLSWYLRRGADSHSTAAKVTEQLQDQSRAVALADLLASNGADLRSPGMYSWWVDEVGAEDLSRGLGHEIAAGLIYAGLAGATRSGGSESSNTLWGRITTMHLGKRHEFSTLRRSLGSILASAHGSSAIDEAELTGWMHAHLRVVTIPIADADTLDALESEILAALDPPLNLAKVSKTPPRLRLSALRKQYAGKPTVVEEEDQDG
ncbi:DUF6884 domain-containing protein [Microlunatus ginsengisoli]|uniref:Uncharacterized protein n=1 Tax=Microlunatus ginsengisoli TaxID=363863 RepID=A0ABP7AIY4_9ACTN